MFYNEIHYDQSTIYNYLSVNQATRRKADTKRGICDINETSAVCDYIKIVIFHKPNRFLR